MHNIYYLGLSGEHRCPLGYLFIVVVIPGHNLGNSQMRVNRTIGPTLVTLI